MKLYTLDNQFIKETDRYPLYFTGIIESYKGSKYWYLNGKLHREVGPALEFHDGSKEWFVEGKLHRMGGPARELADGSKMWWVNDKPITKEQHNLLFGIMKLKGLL